MKNEYLKANVFLSASTIENSPNSLGEAQLLGVPCLASYVGGVPDMIPNERCGQMYRFEDSEAMVYKIAQVFEQSKDFDNTEMRRVASERHSVACHVSDTIKIYRQIMKDTQQ
jgi:Glycosyltransferase